MNKYNFEIYSFIQYLFIYLFIYSMRCMEPYWLYLFFAKSTSSTACVCVSLSRQQDLFRVLKAYTLYRPDEGYCQAQAPIAAVLLMHMPAEVKMIICVLHNT